MQFVIVVVCFSGLRQQRRSPLAAPALAVARIGCPSAVDVTSVEAHAPCAFVASAAQFDIAVVRSCSGNGQVMVR